MNSQELSTFQELLHTKGFSITKQRITLFNILRKHPALTMKELIQKAHSQDPASTYRNINLFERLGVVTKIRLGWNTKIELSDIFQDHHHHLTCSQCGTHTDIGEHDKLEDYIAHIIAKHGYTNATHQLEILGVCRDCKN